jgi:hypothetical protein
MSKIQLGSQIWTHALFIKVTGTVSTLSKITRQKFISYSMVLLDLPFISQIFQNKKTQMPNQKLKIILIIWHIRSFHAYYSNNSTVYLLGCH